MIYLDNAATTFPKPVIVREAVAKSFSFSANPGRAGHRMSIKSAETLYECRNNICELTGFERPENVILLPSCTFAINTVIKGLLKKGDHVVISSLEHNSVARPVQQLADKGIITYSIAEVFERDDDKTLASFRSAMCDKTKLVVCTHASNVFGVKLPIARISALCRIYSVPLCIDAAQTAGISPIDLQEIKADYICLPGHKGLYGPMGTGVLIINSENIPDSLIEGGTGSGSSELKQPDMLPDKFESGTLNLQGFAGLSKGIEFVNKKGINAIQKHEMMLINKLYSEFRNMDDVILYTEVPDTENYVPLLSFNIKNSEPEQVAAFLDKYYGIAVRAGLHCSPLAHKSYSTESTGTVRVCPSVFTGVSDINKLTDALFYYTKNKKIAI